MKAIVVIFDTLIRRYLEPYGCDWTHTPNFARLAGRAATFDNCYGGSMPCIPARRELHTGRYNFLHRSWGPLEPFDDSVPALLNEAGVYTHLTTDHQHYWEDGGATYHNRFRSYEFFRGQEGDTWKGIVGDIDLSANAAVSGRSTHRQDCVNRHYMSSEADHPQTLTFDAGLHFMHTNHGVDNWMLQIETFDPHEPFFTYDDYTKLFPDDWEGPVFDWPSYCRVEADDPGMRHLRLQYAALLSMCDHSLGRVLDAMDEHRLWDDTMLLVGTDHGFLLGEHDWSGKIVMPWYDEAIHTPLFVWDPRSRIAGERRRSLVQTIDIGPTLLDFFGLSPTRDMMGTPLAPAIERDVAPRDTALFGSFGGHVNVTDGRYVYMRGPAHRDNEPLLEHTLMPTRMRRMFTADELKDAALAGPFSFTKGVPVLAIAGASAATNRYQFGSLLFDVEADPVQESPLVDDAVELRMANLMLDAMRAADAPPSQYERLGLPDAGPATVEHLVLGRRGAE